MQCFIIYSIYSIYCTTKQNNETAWCYPHRPHVETLSYPLELLSPRNWQNQTLASVFHSEPFSLVLRYIWTALDTMIYQLWSCSRFKAWGWNFPLVTCSNNQYLCFASHSDEMAVWKLFVRVHTVYHLYEMKVDIFLFTLPLGGFNKICLDHWSSSFNLANFNFLFNCL